VQFFLLQMLVHHPQDAVDERSGAFAVDWDVWKVSKLVCHYNQLSSWVGIVSVSLSVCVLVCTLRGKWLELSTPKLEEI